MVSAARDKLLLIRADADAEIGAGHVMRCLALAQAWQDAGGEAAFVATRLPSLLRRRLVTERCAVIELAAPPGSREDAVLTKRLAAEHDAAWLILDGYQFDADYQATVRRADTRVAVLDDYVHAERYAADLLLNVNLHADAASYAERAPEARLLLGPRYALLRREFRSQRPPRRAARDTARNILVTFGGADPADTTGKALEALRLLGRSDLDVRALVGSCNEGQARLRTVADDVSFAVRLEHAINDMPGALKWADFALCAAGGTVWEMAYMGTPMLITTLADNQRPIAASLHAAGAAYTFGWHADLAPAVMAEGIETFLASAERRRALSERARELVDGQGAPRVVEQLTAQKEADACACALPGE